jgi:dolichol-phosphate mannosyltransferase
MSSPEVVRRLLLAPRVSRVIVVLPAYNEEANLGNLLRRIFESLTDERLGFSIIVVDDGSSDRTQQILEEYGRDFPLTIHRHTRNQGLGATIRDGLREAAAMANERDIVITMDADESHTPGLMIRMIRMIREGYDVVIASRYQRGSRVYGLGLGRRAISRGASLLMRALFPTPGVSDFTCGYRAYRAEALQQAYAEYGESLVDQDGFQCMVDILLKLRKLPLIFGEVPLILRYDLKRGQSKMRLMKTSVNTLGLLWRRRFGA